MNWQELCADPTLQNIPHKMELNQQGQVIMSPASVMHVVFQGKIMALLNRYQPDNLVVPEFPVETRDGVKVVDVGMLLPEQASCLQGHIVAAFAPALCVEVFSSSNTLSEMGHKKALYFEQGATEFWLCDQAGRMSFYTPSGQLGSSRLVDRFPQEISL